MIYISLINNITLLISLAIIHSIILNKWKFGKVPFKIFSGLLFGAVAIVGMKNSLELYPGVFFDGRSIILAIAGLFAGPLSAIIAVISAGIYRLAIGGPGAIMGICVIISSALLGIAMNIIIRKKPNLNQPISYYVLGLAVHMVMLSFLITLPDKLILQILPQVAAPVLLIYPIGTWLVAWLFLINKNHIKALTNLQESEKRFRQIFQESKAIYLLIDPETGKIKDANRAAISFYGWAPAVFKSMDIMQINGMNFKQFKDLAEKIKTGHESTYSLKHLTRKGETREVEVLSGPVAIHGTILLFNTVIDVTEKRKIAEQLSRERNLLRTVIDNIPHQVSVKDTKLRRILSNLSELRFLGKTEAEVLGKKDTELYPHPIGERLGKDDLLVLNKRNALINKEEKLISNNGSIKWFQKSIIPLIDDEKGELISGFVTIKRDVTDRRNAEASIRNLSLVAEKTSNLVVISDPEDKILWVNQSFFKITGYLNDEVMGKTVAELLRGPGTDPAHIQKISEGIATKTDFRQEILNYTKSGEEIWLEVHVNPVLDKNGNIEKIISVCIDITERKKSETMLQQSIQSYSDLFNSLGEAIFILDKESKVLDVNQGAIDMYGYSREEIIGDIPEKLGAQDLNDIDAFKESIIRAYSGEHQEMEVWAKRKNGQVFQKEMHIYPSKYFNKNVVLVIAQDITQRKQSEELKNSLEVANKTARIKQRFLANMSHEMRTPLNGVLGMAEVLKKTKISDIQKKYIKIIEDSSRSLLEIINDVLHLSKIESGNDTLSEKIIHKNEFIQRIRSYFPRLAEKKGLEFHIEFSGNVPDSLIADENRIMQVITNLVGNAIKFTHSGSVSVKCESIENKGTKNFLRISVEDTGEGIKAEHHERIFEEFVQIDSSRTRESGGTGLGLPICKNIVALLGGEIGLESEPGKGSNFWFTFCYRTNITGNTRKTSKKEKPTKLKLEGLSVLLVEDKKVNQMVARLMLQDLGCITHLAENGEIALSMVSKNKYDIILMDIQMPVMDGVTAVKKIRGLNISQPVIIGLSAEAMEGDAEKYIALGMDDYITKPVEQEVLSGKLQKWHLEKRNEIKGTF